MDYLLLLTPSANRVYAGQESVLAAAELSLCVPGVDSLTPCRVAGVDYLAFSADLDDAALAKLSRLSASLALFRRDGQALYPVELPAGFVLDDDIVTIPKYPGKTNEQFTQLLVNVTLAAADPDRRATPAQILDPMCGRGTTLAVAWRLGHHGYGIEAEPSSLTAAETFFKTYLRTRRLKHSAQMSPLRRDGVALGKKLSLTLKSTNPPLIMEMMPGDGRDSRALWGKRSFDAIVTDAPYGVVHGARAKAGNQVSRSRSPEALLAEAIPVWAGQLRGGGALGLSWNTLGLPRIRLAEIIADAGLQVCDGGEWEQLSHRVDSSIRRDVIVARKPRRGLK